MNLGLAENAAEALRLSQRSSGSGSHHRHLDAAPSDMEDSFLVSDDEEELEESKSRRRSSIKHSTMAKDDYSPIPVRALQRRSSSKRNMVKERFPNESEPKILLPHEGLTMKKTPLGLAIQPRHSSRSRFSSNLDDGHPSMTQSSNLLQQRQHQLPSTQLQPQNLLGHEKPRFPTLAATVATAIATATTDTDVDHSHAHSPLKHVTFSSQAASSTAPQEATAATMAASRNRRMRTRSQSIAIQKTSMNGSSNSISMDSANFGNVEEEDSSYNEQLYDNATWRMYHRIVEHRQNQQRYNQSSSSSDSSASEQGSFQQIKTASQQHMLHPQQHQQYFHQGYAAAAPSANMDEDGDEGIFEMEL